MNSEDEEKVRIEGYLHDAIEDTDVDFPRLAEGFRLELAEIVQLLTREKGRSPNGIFNA